MIGLADSNGSLSVDFDSRSAVRAVAAVVRLVGLMAKLPADVAVEESSEFAILAVDLTLRLWRQFSDRLDLVGPESSFAVRLEDFEFVLDYRSALVGRD